MAILKLSAKNLTKIQIDLICKYMESSVCKIKNGNGGEGTAFFCLIPYDQYISIPTIITSNLVIGEIDTGKSIEISFNNGLFSKVINFDESRLTYTNNESYIAIIEIKEKDGTEQGSAGAPIINLKNNKIIGIHRGYMPRNNVNIDNSIKKSVEEFVKKIKDSKMFNNLWGPFIFGVIKIKKKVKGISDFDT